jgi:hypothetical protein
MQVTEAKDFLVQQADQQAQLEGVSLSDLEKRMMYFTESSDATEDPYQLNEEFEAKYDNEEYEAKVSQLLRRARTRLEKENPQAARLWDEAVGVLRKGDHYILILLGVSSIIERPPLDLWKFNDILKLIGTAVLLVGVGLALVIASHLYIEGRIPRWMQWSAIGLVAGAYSYYAVLPMILKEPPIGIGQLLRRFFHPKS